MVRIYDLIRSPLYYVTIINVHVVIKKAHQVHKLFNNLTEENSVFNYPLECLCRTSWRLALPLVQGLFVCVCMAFILLWHRKVRVFYLNQVGWHDQTGFIQTGHYRKRWMVDIPGSVSIKHTTTEPSTYVVPVGSSPACAGFFKYLTGEGRATPCRWLWVSPRHCLAYSHHNAGLLYIVLCGVKRKSNESINQSTNKGKNSCI